MGRREEAQDRGLYVYLRQIHMATQQKPTQHSETITLQLKTGFKWVLS